MDNAVRSVRPEVLGVPLGERRSEPTRAFRGLFGEVAVALVVVATLVDGRAPICAALVVIPATPATATPVELLVPMAGPVTATRTTTSG